MRLRLLSPALPLALALLVLPACRHAAVAEPPPAAVVPAAPVQAADDNLNAVLWMQASSEYRAAATQTWRAAGARLDQALADPGWDALAPGERDTPATGLPPAVIVDVDETVLDNSPYQARLGRGLQLPSWFGERWWMLPNPSYGDWQPAQFDNDWSLSPAQRREAKRAALDTAR